MVPRWIRPTSIRFRELAVYIGPIAPIVTRKAARDAKGRADFLRRVADNLGTQERVAFLHEFGLGGS
jgi:hypothetical protein